MGGCYFNDDSGLWWQDSLNLGIKNRYYGSCGLGKLLVFHLDQLHLSLLGKDIEREKMYKSALKTVAY